MQTGMSVYDFIIEKQADFPHATGDLSALLTSIQHAAKVISWQINQAGLGNIIGATGIDNIQGEAQQKLDLFANDKFKQSLAACGEVCGMASEEDDDYVAFEPVNGKTAKYVVLIDPLDGSSNIDVGVSVGTLFSIYHRVSPIGTPVTKADFFTTRSSSGCCGLYHLWFFNHAGLFDGAGR